MRQAGKGAKCAGLVWWTSNRPCAAVPLAPSGSDSVASSLPWLGVRPA